MNKKRKIIAWIIICSLWNFAVITIHIIMRSQLKFPTLNFEFFGWLIPVFMTVPFHGMFFGIISVYRKRFMKIFAIAYTTVGIICYISFVAAVTLGFSQWEPALYPLISETDNISFYLVLDNETEYEAIFKMFPSDIPASANNIQYKYRYEPIELDYEVNAQWLLSQTDYDSEKMRVKQNADECEQVSGKTLYKLWWQGEAEHSPGVYYNAEVEFDSETKEVKYRLLKNTVTS